MLKSSALLVVTVTSIALCGCSTVSDFGPPTGFETPTGDMIAIGRLKNLRYDPDSFDPDDLIGYGWFYGTFHVSRFEHGDIHRKVVPVRYFAHTHLREDIAFRFRLRPSESGDYFICKSPGSAGYNCD